MQGKRAALENLPPHTAGSPRRDSGSGGRRSSKASQGQPGSRTECRTAPPPVVVAAIAAQALHDEVEEARGRDDRPELDAAAVAVEGVMTAAGRSGASLASAGHDRGGGSGRAAVRPAERSQPLTTHSGSSQHAIAASVDLGDLSGQSTPERSSGEAAGGGGATGGASAPRRAGRGTESMSPTPSPPPVLVRALLLFVQ